MNACAPRQPESFTGRGQAPDPTAQALDEGPGDDDALGDRPAGLTVDRA